ncbi:hypothetical protein TSOC_011496 [Tetrabaena socialis]|uniref:RPA-interacting protein C-terminal domain-containing protein n=1 Tax=Tetrabaena socialis TaxID=47790 RepID=A0A2J7ZQH3_9CHLO|nr:hypothetical protein TSOC_011496 [Tetrabaena socialis]|eukprot:PNH02517.1 hypothetical protein TSOC_011496 [Tetrabaena socialis]
MRGMLQQEAAHMMAPGAAPVAAWDDPFFREDESGGGAGGALPQWEEAEMAAAVAELQAELYQAIADELQAMEEEEARYLEHMAEEAFAGQFASCAGEPASGRPHGADEPGADSVLCPVCGRAALVMLHGIIACPAERWQLDGRTEGLGLPQLRQRLAGVFEEHHASGCRTGRLHFYLDSCPAPGQLAVPLGIGPSLLASCDVCRALHVVL